MCKSGLVIIKYACIICDVPTLQISMSVHWRCTHVIPMQTVLIQMAASSAHVWLDLKAMDLTVQVIVE